VLPGFRYSDPEFSWKFAVPPAGIGFLATRALDPSDSASFNKRNPQEVQQLLQPLMADLILQESSLAATACIL
jgi:hypothetical protein